MIANILERIVTSELHSENLNASQNLIYEHVVRIVMNHNHMESNETYMSTETLCYQHN